MQCPHPRSGRVACAPPACDVLCRRVVLLWEANEGMPGSAMRGAVSQERGAHLPTVLGACVCMGFSGLAQHGGIWALLFRHATSVWQGNWLSIVIGPVSKATQ